MPPKSKSRAATAHAVPTAAPPAVHPALAALARSRWLYALLSLPLLAPCLWQSRIQAGDLSSHVYNSWLAQLIASGRVQGLAVAGQSTNILFDLLLGALFQTLGAAAAQRISVSLAVLIFIWGAFAFARAVSGRPAWHILPIVAVLAYGWVFHMGFFNFYLSLGLCFWALALLWKPSPGRVAGAVAILALAYLAHALPVAWAAGLAAYFLLARRMSSKSRAYLIAASLLVMLLLHAALRGAMQTGWSLQQITMITGLDQAWVFDGKYYAVQLGLLLVCGSLLLHLVRATTARQVVSGIPFQLCMITAAAVVILPTSILIPGFRHSLVYIAERMSLAVGICGCALLAAVPPRRFERYALALVTLLFFAFLFRDERLLNSFEDQMQQTVAALPPGQRVISAIDDPSLRVNALAHIIDRACLGHCYSYANYEPSTAQFRVRALSENPYVAYTYQDSWLLQVGAYVVKPADVPLYQVDLDAHGRMVLKSLRAGVPSGSTAWKVLADSPSSQ